MMRLLSNALILSLVVIWALGRRQRVWADLSYVMLGVILLLAVECGNGVLRFANVPPLIATTHRWLAHGLVIVAWCLSVVTVTAMLLSIRRRPLAALSITILVAMLSALIALESFTGYLPLDDRAANQAAAETHNRFVVLHCFALPIAITAFSILSALAFRKINGGNATRAVCGHGDYGSPRG